MHSFENRFRDTVTDAGLKGWLVAILELGAWFGVLVSGELRVQATYSAVLIFV